MAIACARITDAFPNGRMTNYTRYIKTDLEARGELERVAKKKPQRIRLV